MTNRELVASFLTSYQRHEWKEMHACLDPEVEFRDLAFKSIKGADVRAMWRWFCEPTDTRKEPVQVPGFEIRETQGDYVHAEYWVRYELAGGKRVNYVIRSIFTVVNGRIVLQVDEPMISNLEFGRMAMGFPACLLALTPAFKPAIRRTMRKRLDDFVDPHRAKATGKS